MPRPKPKAVAKPAIKPGRKRPARRRNANSKSLENWLKSSEGKKVISKLQKEANATSKMLDEARKPPHPIYKKK